MAIRERRQSRRVPAHCPVQYFYTPPSAPAAHTLDLSESGACLQAFDPLILGAGLSFLLLTSDRCIVDVRARVVHVQPGQDSPYHIGVYFTTISADGRASLAREISCPAA
jgi:hypothetical protein